jgi:hypothetical protein
MVREMQGTLPKGNDPSSGGDGEGASLSSSTLQGVVPEFRIGALKSSFYWNSAPFIKSRKIKNCEKVSALVLEMTHIEIVFDLFTENFTHIIASFLCKIAFPVS